MRSVFGKDLQRANPKTPGSRSGALRSRWVDRKGQIYEFDRQHGTIEKYDRSGRRHLGEYNPKTGETDQGARQEQKGAEVMAWYVGAFSKTGNEELVKSMPTVGIDIDFVRQTWSLADDDPVIGACYEVTEDNMIRVQAHVAEQIDLEIYQYEPCDERD